MLKDLDLDKSLSKESHKSLSEPLYIRLGELQRKARELGIPVLVAFEGWEASGKGTQINRLLQALDPRGYNVHVGEAEDEDERLRPFWWRFWIRTPAKGRFSIFDRSWCMQAIDCLTRKEPDRDAFDHACREINAFERQLTDDGTVILKFFLHIGKKEQKKRFDVLEEHASTAWRVSRDDWAQNRHYDAWRDAVQEMLERTDTERARWHLVESEDKRFAAVKIASLLVDALESAVMEREKSPAEKTSIIAREMKPDAGAKGLLLSSNCAAIRGLPGDSRRSNKGLSSNCAANSGLPGDSRRSMLGQSSVLDAADLSKAIQPAEYEAELEKWQLRVRDMEHAMYKARVPLMVLYEGWDAAGKGGNIRRLTSKMDPRGYDVIPIAAPNDIEKAHHYLWRFWNAVPKAGHIAIFDRTWYGRVLVERVEGFCTEAEWKRAYREINEMEEQLTDAGMGLVKFWLHIDPEEQLRRFEERQEVSWKTWKITEEDWRNREKWDRYKEAVDEMLFRTGTSRAPWTVVEANDKYYARVKALRTVVETMEKVLSF